VQLFVVMWRKSRRSNVHPHRLLAVNKDFKNVELLKPFLFTLAFLYR